METSQLLLLSVLLLLSASLVSSGSFRLVLKCLGVLMILWLFHVDRLQGERLANEGLVDVDTAYYRVLIRSEKRKADGRTLRYLQTDALGSQALMFLDSPSEMAAPYGRFYALSFFFNPHIERVLVLGGGAYMLPKWLLAEKPGTAIDVVEIDPGITKLAREHFFLPVDERLSIFHEDARRYLSRCRVRYDSVAFDVFGSSASVPFHLTTREAMSLIRDVLSPEGVFAMNIISAMEGEEGRFFRAEVETLKAVFSEVLVFPTASKHHPKLVQNILLIALKSSPAVPLAEGGVSYAELLAHRLERDVPSDMPILTDEFAPVEQYIAPVFAAWRRQEKG